MHVRRLIPTLCLALAVFGRLSPARSAEPTPAPLTAKGIDNVFRVTARLYSGSQPEGDEGFSALRALGVRTILSVDGTPPDVDRAARFGLRYVHIPHGYDGIPPATAARLAKAAATAEGPVYVHCHHGRHRGPAAVGIIGQATAGWSTNQAVAFLKQAGTSADYPGLYRSNLEFRPPTAAELAAVPTHFPARAEVSGLVDAMVEIDRRWDHLKAIRDAGWRVPEDQPDLVPASEAKLLAEAYRELQRTAEARAKGEPFLGDLRGAEAKAEALHVSLLAAPATAGDHTAPLPVLETFQAAGQSCTACHRQFRN